MESQIRSWVKSAIWRVMGVIILALVTYVYTKDFIVTTWVTVLHHAVFFVVFALHERFWLHVDYKGLKRKIMKAVTYETILGNFILAIITLVITGDVHTMSKITLTYIGIKHIVYIWNEFIWDKITLGKSA